MTNRNEKEQAIRDENAASALPAHTRMGEYRELGAFSTSFDEFESLMSSLGYRRSVSADLQGA